MVISKTPIIAMSIIETMMENIHNTEMCKNLYPWAADTIVNIIMGKNYLKCIKE